MSNTVYVNQKTYEAVVTKMGYKPENLVVNNYVEDNKAIVIDNDTIDLLKPKELSKSDYLTTRILSHKQMQ